MSSIRDTFQRRLPRPVRRVSVNLALVDNRIEDFLQHSKRYAFKGQARLAQDVRVSDVAVSRLLSRCGSPSYALIARITQALEKEFKRTIDPREIASLNGKYPTASVCEVVGCGGCSPEEAWSEENELTLP